MTMHTQYFKMWICMRVQTPLSACGWPSGLAKSSAFSPVFRLSDIILKHRKKQRKIISLLFAWGIFLVSMWPSLSYMNDETVRHDIIISTFVGKCRCNMPIDMAFPFVYIFLECARFLRQTFPNKWATTWQNQQNKCAPSEDSDQPGYPPSLIGVFAVRMKKAWILSYPLNAERRLWSY